MRVIEHLFTAFRSPSAMPLRVFAAILVLVFVVEYAVMVFLASISPPRPEGDSLDMLDSVFLTVLLAPAIWWLVVRPLQKLFEARGRLLAQVFQAQEDERARIARDLHDELGQQLTAVMLGLRAAQEAQTLDQARRHAATAANLGADALEAVRAIARGLRPAVLEDLGLGPALDRLCEEFRSVHDVEVVLENAIPSERRFHPVVETCVYRLLQESLTNAARHSGATKVRAGLSVVGAAVVLAVSDDGKGFDPEGVGPGSTGLQGMRERVTMLDGRLRVESHPGGGTRVVAHVPFDVVASSPGALATAKPPS